MKSPLILALCIGLLLSFIAAHPNRPFARQSLQTNQLQFPRYAQSGRLAQPDDEYILSWKWTARKDYANSARGVFYWNDKVIANITTSDYVIHASSFHVKALNGVNILRIKAEGADGAIGFDIDDITLIKKGENHNYIVNGDF